MRINEPEIQPRVPAGSRGGILIGVLMVILGLVAIARPLYATLASTLVFGWVFIIAGIAQVIYAFHTRRLGQLVGKLLLGILYIIGGILVLANPIAGVLTLTLVLGITIFVQGVIQVIVAFQLRSSQRLWILLSGIAGIILGIFIWSAWPFNADWIIGFWVGINLFFDGIWLTMHSASAPSTLP